MLKEFRGGAGELKLAAQLSSGVFSFTIDGDPTGWPTGSSAPFVIDIGNDESTAEKLLIDSRAGNIFIVVPSIGRGWDGTTPQAHGVGAIVRHVIDADTFQEANTHVNDDTQDDHPQYLNTTRHDTTARHAAGTVIPVGSPVASAPGDTGSDGSSSALARANHRHARESWGLVGDVTASAPGNTAAAGATGKPADAGHRHAREAWGTASDMTISGPADVAAAGSTGRVADAGHRHSREFRPTITTSIVESLLDQGLNPGDELTCVAEVISVGTGGRLVDIFVGCDIRPVSAGVGVNNVAGELRIKVDGVQRVKRHFHTHDSDGRLEPSITWAENMAAGSHTILCTVYSEASSGGAMYMSNRVMVNKVTGG